MFEATDKASQALSPGFGDVSSIKTITLKYNNDDGNEETRDFYVPKNMVAYLRDYTTKSELILIPKNFIQAQNKNVGSLDKLGEIGEENITLNVQYIESPISRFKNESFTGSNIKTIPLEENKDFYKINMGEYGINRFEDLLVYYKIDGKREEISLTHLKDFIVREDVGSEEIVVSEQSTYFGKVDEKDRNSNNTKNKLSEYPNDEYRLYNFKNNDDSIEVLSLRDVKTYYSISNITDYKFGRENYNNYIVFPNIKESTIGGDIFYDNLNPQDEYHPVLLPGDFTLGSDGKMKLSSNVKNISDVSESYDVYYFPTDLVRYSFLIKEVEINGVGNLDLEKLIRYVAYENGLRFWNIDFTETIVIGSIDNQLYLGIEKLKDVVGNTTKLKNLKIWLYNISITEDEGTKYESSDDFNTLEFMKQASGSINRVGKTNSSTDPDLLVLSEDQDIMYENQDITLYDKNDVIVDHVNSYINQETPIKTNYKIKDKEPWIEKLNDGSYITTGRKKDIYSGVIEDMVSDYKSLQTENKEVEDSNIIMEFIYDTRNQNIESDLNSIKHKFDKIMENSSGLEDSLPEYYKNNGDPAYIELTNNRTTPLTFSIHYYEKENEKENLVKVEHNITLESGGKHLTIPRNSFLTENYYDVETYRTNEILEKKILFYDNDGEKLTDSDLKMKLIYFGGGDHY